LNVKKVLYRISKVSAAEEKELSKKKNYSFLVINENIRMGKNLDRYAPLIL